MGRPKVTEVQACAAFLIQARVSPGGKNKSIAGAIDRAGVSASEWVRKTLLSAAERKAA